MYGNTYNVGNGEQTLGGMPCRITVVSGFPWDTNKPAAAEIAKLEVPPVLEPYYDAKLATVNMGRQSLAYKALLKAGWKLMGWYTNKRPEYQSDMSRVQGETSHRIALLSWNMDVPEPVSVRPKKGKFLRPQWAKK